jgi:hypothetical protein
MTELIPIRVDEDGSGPRMRGPASSSVAKGIVTVAADKLKEQVADLSRILAETTAATPPDSPFEVAELRFTLHIEANGEVSVMSVLKGAATAGAGIEVTLRKRGLPAD